MNKIIVFCAIGCILHHVQLSFALTCYNCTSTSQPDCKANLTQSFTINCNQSVTTCYFAVSDTSASKSYDVQRGCGKLNQESKIYVDYDVEELPLYDIKTCTTNLCNNQPINVTAPSNESTISCYNCSTMMAPECRSEPHKYNSTCPHIESADKAYCYKIEFTFNSRQEIQRGCGVFKKNDTIFQVPNKYEAHMDRLITCTGPLCNAGSAGKSAVGILIFLSFFGSKYLSQFI